MCLSIIFFFLFVRICMCFFVFFFFQAEDGIRDWSVTGVQTCALPISRIIDAERREQFTAQGAHFESDYFVSLTYLPPVEHEERITGWLFEGQKQKVAAGSRALSRFRRSEERRVGKECRSGWSPEH